MRRLGRFIRDNGLTLAFLLLLVLALIGQSIAGVANFNAQQLSSGGQAISWLAYLRSSSFAVDVAENWQSEYLQFALYIVATTWLVQRGSSESKKREDLGTQSDKDQKIGRYAYAKSPGWAKAGGWRTALYGRTLGAVMTFFFLASLLAQSIAGRAAFNHDQLTQNEDPLTWFGYVRSADFWDRTFQNWQSEFLAVASMAAFAIYLRQRGSPESKLVGAAHDATGMDS
jgi:membrane protein implicated in regulation of membrane protease activity